MVANLDNVLITGASGCIGGAVAMRLQRMGANVRGLVRPTSSTQALEAAGIELAVGDVVDADAVRKAMDGVRIVFHFAGLFRKAGLPDQVYRDVHARGTQNVLNAARVQGVERVVHCSTVGVHGDVGDAAVDEEAPFRPGDVYQRTKLEAELKVQKAIREGLPAVVCRPAGVYGPPDDRHLKLFRLLQRGRFVMFGSGKALWHPVYIDDLVDGFLLAATKAEALGRTYILAGPEHVTLNDWINEVAKAVGGRAPKMRFPFAALMAASVACEAVCKPLGLDPPLHPRRARFFKNNRAFSIERARNELGYQPSVGIAEGVRRTAAWYREVGLLA